MEEARGELRALADSLQAAGGWLSVEGAFLSLLAPDLPAACAAAVAAGARQVHVLPLFLFSGKHILADIPEQVEALRAAHPGLHVILLDPIARHPDFTAFLRRAAEPPPG